MMVVDDSDPSSCCDISGAGAEMVVKVVVGFTLLCFLFFGDIANHGNVADDVRCRLVLLMDVTENGLPRSIMGDNRRK